MGPTEEVLCKMLRVSELCTVLIRAKIVATGTRNSKKKKKLQVQMDHLHFQVTDVFLPYTRGSHSPSASVPHHEPVWRGGICIIVSFHGTLLPISLLLLE